MKKLLLIVLALFINIFVNAQDGDVDFTFNPSDLGFGFGDGSNGIINEIALQPDGKIIIGGNFTRYNGTLRSRLARLNTDGTLDVGFNIGTGLDESVEAVVLQSDGKIIIGGSFSTFNGTPSNGIARLNADGTLDTSFNLGTGVIGYYKIWTIVIQPDGKIIIGGDFYNYNGTPVNKITRLNTNGTIDTEFNVGTGFNYDVYTTALQPDGKIIVGGGFTYFNGMATNRIARLNPNGTLDTSFNIGSGANTSVRTSALQPDGKIIIGGSFYNYNGVPVNRIARLNINGTLDTTFTIGTGADNNVYATAVQSDGKIIIGGSFYNYNGISIKGIARLNPNGTLDIDFNMDTGLGYAPRSAKIQPDGKIILASSYSYYNGISIKGIARLNTNGTLDSAFNVGTGADNYVYASAVQSDGKILIGGRFVNYNGTPTFHLARLNTNGSLDTTFNVGTGINSYAGINSIVVQPDGKIIVGGFFSGYNGTLSKGIVRLDADGTIDTTFNVGTGVDNTVNIIALQPDGKIIIGGFFQSYNEIPSSRIARLNIDGTLDTSFNVGTGTNSYSNISAIAVRQDGKVIIGGKFSSFNGTPINGIARLNTNGSLDTTFNVGTGIDSYADIKSIVVQPDGKIIIGGYFNNYNGVPINRIARLNINGTLDSGFNVGSGANSRIRTMSLQSDGKIIIGGSFSSFNGTPINGIARLNTNGSLDTTFNVGTGVGAYYDVYTTALQSDGKIIIGGTFWSYNSIGRNRILRVNASGALAIEENEIIPNVITVYNNNNILTIKSTNSVLQSVNIFDVTGRPVYKNKQVNNIALEISNFNIKNQLLIIKVMDSNYRLTTKKLLVE